MSTAVLVIRLALGAALFLQGYAKLTRDGRRSTAAWFAEVGFRPAGPLALLAAVVEVGTGTLFLAGLATPLAAAGAIGLLTVAAAVNGSNGYWNANGGAEYPLVLGVVAAGLAFSGAGDASLDAALGWAGPTTATAVSSVVLGVLAAVPPTISRSRTLRQQRPVARTELSKLA